MVTRYTYLDDIVGEINVTDNAVVTAVSTTPAQITVFDTNGLSRGVTPDHTNDHLTILTTGTYEVSWSVSAENSGGVGLVLSTDLAINNNDSTFDNLHKHRTLSSGTDIGVMASSGYVNLTEGDTLEMWVTGSNGVAKDIVFSDVTLHIEKKRV